MARTMCVELLPTPRIFFSAPSASFETSTPSSTLCAPRSTAAMAFFDSSCTRLDEIGDLLGAGAGALGEVLDLVGDDGEALAVLAGLRGDDGGVEREQVGLLGDVVDDVEDLADLVDLPPRLAMTRDGLLPSSP